MAGLTFARKRRNALAHRQGALRSLVWLNSGSTPLVDIESGQQWLLQPGAQEPATSGRLAN